MDLARYIQKLGNIKYECGVPLSSLCTFKIGGPADIVVKPSTRDELVLSVSEVIKCNIPYLVIGNGSNLLFDDDGTADNELIKMINDFLARKMGK